MQRHCLRGGGVGGWTGAPHRLGAGTSREHRAAVEGRLGPTRRLAGALEPGAGPRREHRAAVEGRLGPACRQDGEPTVAAAPAELTGVGLAVAAGTAELARAVEPDAIGSQRPQLVRRPCDVLVVTDADDADAQGDRAPERLLDVGQRAAVAA